jgi:hypothetical protein
MLRCLCESTFGADELLLIKVCIIFLKKLLLLLQLICVIEFENAEIFCSFCETTHDTNTRSEFTFELENSPRENLRACLNLFSNFSCDIHRLFDNSKIVKKVYIFCPQTTRAVTNLVFFFGDFG